VSFTGDKPLLSSLTMRGGLVLLLQLLFRLLGFDLGDEQAGFISNVADVVITIFGLVMVVWGRYRANQKLTM
jgi:uncharacterized membrane protein